jgi:beta-barrel assembly-enhancing protease
MKMTMVSRIIAIAASITLGALPAQGDQAAVRAEVKEAIAAADANHQGAAYTTIQKAVADSSFATLETSTQHAALELAYLSAYKAKDFDAAHGFSYQATMLPEQAAQDWSYRVYSAAQINNGADEAVSIARMVKIWGANSVGTDSIRRAFRDTRSAQLSAARKEMLLALYDARWRPADASSASRLWLTLSLSLLEGNDAAKASQVAPLIDDPTDVIAMHADRRYKQLLNAPYFESNAHDAARTRISALRRHLEVNPRSLVALVLLAQSLLNSREDQEVLELTTQADRKIAETPATVVPFDDIEKNHPWILNEKATALSHLGRFEDAARELRRAYELPHRNDSVSHAINLASILCELDRADEALSLLPKMGDAGDYGKLQIALVELTVATEKRDSASQQQHLDYLREHAQISPQTYQRALLIAGEFGGAEAFMLTRLADPEMRTDALLELQVYAPKKYPPKAQAWQAEQEKLKTAPSIQKAAAAVGSIGHYTWRYD